MKGISLKVNIIARLEFELVAIQYDTHYTTETPTVCTIEGKKPLSQ